MEEQLNDIKALQGYIERIVALQNEVALICENMKYKLKEQE